MPPALLEEVFALNEELDEIRDAARRRRAGRRRWQARLERARQPIEAKRIEHEGAAAGAGGAVGRRWRPRGVEGLLAAISSSKRNYIHNLLAGIERELNS